MLKNINIAKSMQDSMLTNVIMLCYVNKIYASSIELLQIGVVSW